MKYYVVDAFTKEHYHGNPAGVCILEQWPDDSVMQNIAYENNLAETAFVVKNNGYYDLRWFTPEVEIDLCGHATLGSAHVITQYVDPSAGKLEFHTKSGVLTVTRDKELYVMDFPARKPVPYKASDILEKALGVTVLETHIARDLLVVVEAEAIVKGLNPNFEQLKNVDPAFGIIVTAKGTDCDFVSRFFAPGAGINEDPVTGSSHTTLIPFWSERLGRNEMIARQLSQRGGTLYCKNCGGRVQIAGTAVTHLIGEIIL